MVQDAKGLKQKLKTHVGMARGPARCRERQKIHLYEYRSEPLNSDGDAL